MQAKLKKFVVATKDKVNNYIHDDLAFSILSKLPLKSLKRFQCVCKSWFLLFDNPNFMSMYHINFLSKYPSYDDNTSLILLLKMHEQLYYLSGKRFENTVKSDRPNLFPDQVTDLEFCGLGTINGMLCLEDKYLNKVVLWNPDIKEFKFIPQSPFESFSPPATLNFEATVVFEVDTNLHGFGYDYVRDDYKLIRHTQICPFFPDYPDSHINCPSDKDVSLIRDKSLDSSSVYGWSMSLVAF
jgi:molecular chaperone HtpG